MPPDQLTDEQLDAIWNEEEPAGANAPAGDPETPEPPDTAGDATGETPAQDAPAGDAPAGEPEKQPEQPTTQVDPVLEEIRATLSKLDGRVRNTEGHIGGLNSAFSRFQQEQQAAAQAAATQRHSGNDAPSSAQMAAASKDLTKWNQLKADFPEWGDALEERLGALAVPRVDENALRAQWQQEMQQREAALQAQLGELRIEVAHRGWKQTVKTPEFHEWRRSQGPEVEALAHSSRPEDAIRMLDLYQEAAKARLPQTAQQIEADRRARLAAAAAPSGVAGSTRRSVNEMTDDEVWEADNPFKKR